MPEEKMKEQIRDAAVAFVKASDRTRYVLIIIIITSIVSSVAFWNSLRSSFLTQRVHTAEFAHTHKIFSLKSLPEKAYPETAELLAFVDLGFLRSVEPESMLSDKSRKLLVSLGRYRMLVRNSDLEESQEKFPYLDKISSDSLAALNRDSLYEVISDVIPMLSLSGTLEIMQTLKERQEHVEALLVKSLRLCHFKGFNDELSTLLYLWHIDELFIGEVIGVEVPFIEVLMDINDLGLMTGIGFFIVLLWYRNSIRKEYTNLAEALKLAEKGDQLELTYRYLSMRQFFTVPKRLGAHSIKGGWGFQLSALLVEPSFLQPEKVFAHKIVRSIPLAIFLLPVFIQTAIVVNDFRTWEHGLASSTYNKLSGMLSTASLLDICILLLTFRCLSIFLHVYKEWDSAWEKIGKM